MSENFKIEIISPEKKILTQEITSVTLPAFEGDITILYNHIPLITFLRPGIIIINDDEKLQYFVEDGTVEFSNNSLSLLTSTIHELNKLSKEQIDKIISESKDKLNEPNLDDKKRYIISHKIDCLSRVNL